MKTRLIFLLATSLGLNVALISSSLAQIDFGQMPFTSTKATLLAQTQDIETLLLQAIQYTQQGKPLDFGQMPFTPTKATLLAQTQDIETLLLQATSNRNSSTTIKIGEKNRRSSK